MFFLKGPRSESKPKLDGSCSLEISNDEEERLIFNNNEKLRKLYDLRYSCEDLDPDCQCKREKAKNLTKKYYETAAKEAKRLHEYFNGTHSTFVKGKFGVNRSVSLAYLSNYPR